MLKKIFRIEEQISGPLEVTHVVHLDSSLNWSIDPSVDPRQIFQPIKIIGKGGFGVVWQVLHTPSTKILAGKIINPTLVDDRTRSEIEAEIQLMRDVESPYTVKYYGSVKYDGSLMILMEYCEGGSLRDLLDSRERVLTEDQIAIVMYDLLKGLQLIHTRHRIVHRDIKAANILLTSAGRIQIADFGVSRRFNTGRCQTVTIVGTPYWMAPEVISGISYSFPADLWSVGITAVELAEGAPPYIELAATKAMIEIAVNGFPGYRFPEMHSPEFCDFVSHCVMQNPNERWTITELMEHPFIKKATRLPRTEVLEDMLMPVSEKKGEWSVPSTFAVEGRHSPARIGSATRMETGEASSTMSLGSDLLPSGDEFASSSSFRPHSGTFDQEELRAFKLGSCEVNPQPLVHHKRSSSQADLLSPPPRITASSNSGTEANVTVPDATGNRSPHVANSVMAARRPRFTSQPFTNPELRPLAKAQTVAHRTPFVRMRDTQVGAAETVYQRFPLQGENAAAACPGSVDFWKRIRRSKIRPFVVLGISIALLGNMGVEGFVGGWTVILIACVFGAILRERIQETAPA
jgi:serine/threonine protein kinase